MNGTPNSGVTYQYDESGMLASAFEDWKYDATINGVVTSTRDSAGNPLLEEHRIAADSLGDDYRVIRTYDRAGNQLTERYQYLEGVLSTEERSCFARSYDACGNLLAEDSWDGCDQPVARRRTYSYDCFGG